MAFDRAEPRRTDAAFGTRNDRVLVQTVHREFARRQHRSSQRRAAHASATHEKTKCCGSSARPFLCAAAALDARARDIQKSSCSDRAFFFVIPWEAKLARPAEFGDRLRVSAYAALRSV